MNYFAKLIFKHKLKFLIFWIIFSLSLLIFLSVTPKKFSLVTTFKFGPEKTESIESAAATRTRIIHSIIPEIKNKLSTINLSSHPYINIYLIDESLIALRTTPTLGEIESHTRLHKLLLEEIHKEYKKLKNNLIVDSNKNKSKLELEIQRNKMLMDFTDNNILKISEMLSNLEQSQTSLDKSTQALTKFFTTDYEIKLLEQKILLDNYKNNIILLQKEIDHLNKIIQSSDSLTIYDFAKRSNESLPSSLLIKLLFSTFLGLLLAILLIVFTNLIKLRRFD